MGRSGLEPHGRFQSRCWQDFQSSERLTRPIESNSKRTHSHGHWKEASVPCHMDTSIVLLECPCNMAASFRPVRVQGRAIMSFIIYPQKSHDSFHTILCSLEKRHVVQPTHNRERI